MRALIIEDEQPAAKRLITLLQNNPDIEILGTAASGKEAVEKIEQMKPEVIFLDIQLPDISGLDVLHLISHQPLVVFTTAYDEYAIQAFEMGAVDYLLKPFDEERLERAMQRVAERLQTGGSPEQLLEKLLQQWQPSQNYLKRIPVKVGQKILILNVDEIIYFASENKLVFAHLFDKKYILNYTLEELEKRLNPADFFRIHRSTIVNMNYVVSIEPWFGGTYRMKVKDRAGSELSISRQAAKELRQRLGW